MWWTVTCCGFREDPGQEASLRQGTVRIHVRLFEAPADLVTRAVIRVCGRLRGSEVEIRGV